MEDATAKGVEISVPLADERRRVEDFITLFSLPHVDYAARVYPQWSAKDVLAHIVYWHESFARNIEALALGHKPSPPKWSLRETNQISVEENRSVSKAALLRRLRAAQSTIERHIGNEDIGLIPYRRGSRPYSRAEHLGVVAGHIRDHHWHVVRSLITRATV
ncbi:maleylpyruvate isomerase N-terminal domain-containing protein [Nocardia sp. MW-W600-9]